MKLKEGKNEECAAGPVVTRAQAKKSDKVHPLKDKERLCPVLTIGNIENLQKKDSTINKRELCSIHVVLQEELIALPEATRI